MKYLANECRCICHSSKFGIAGDLGCLVYHDKEACTDDEQCIKKKKYKSVLVKQAIKK
tara:strand:+ start:9615 stop:9788 length:174 start_codon:yes stop_codon:yes gene_type:complete